MSNYPDGMTAADHAYLDGDGDPACFACGEITDELHYLPRDGDGYCERCYDDQDRCGHCDERAHDKLEAYDYVTDRPTDLCATCVLAMNGFTVVDGVETFELTEFARYRNRRYCTITVARGNRAIGKRFGTCKEARAEAQRLARAKPNHCFHVWYHEGSQQSYIGQHVCEVAA